MASVSSKEHAMDRIMMQLSELIIVIQSVNEKRGQPTVLKSFQLYLQGVFSRAVQSDPREPRPSHVLQKVTGILTRAIKRMEKIDDMFDQSGTWKDIQEVDTFKSMMKDLKMYIQMLNLAPLEDHSGALPQAGYADSAPLDRDTSPTTTTTRTRSPATVSPNPTPRTASPRRGRPTTAMTASAIGAKMARRERERELSIAAEQLAPPVQDLRPAAPEERPPQPAAAMPSTLPHGLGHDPETTQDSTAVEVAMQASNPSALEYGSTHQPTPSGVALQEYADVADLPFIPTIAKRSNPATVSDSDGASSLAPPGTSRAVMEIRETASRALSVQQAAAASLAAARSTRDALSVAASTPEGSAHGPCLLSARNAPGTLGDGDSAPCLCSSPRGAEQLFLHKSPSHAPGGRPAAAATAAAAESKASPDELAAARQSYAIDRTAVALPHRPGTAAAAPVAAPASGTSAGTAASAATAPADLAAAAAALQPAPPRNGLQPQPVSRPAPGSISPPILYGKLPGPPSATPGSPVNHQSSAASGSTSVSSGHKVPAYRLRPAAPASPSRRVAPRAPTPLRALDDLSNKLAPASVSGSAMSATAMSATGGMAGLSSIGKGGVGESRLQPPPAQGCSLSAIFCRGTAPKD